MEIAVILLAIQTGLAAAAIHHLGSRLWTAALAAAGGVLGLALALPPAIATLGLTLTPATTLTIQALLVATLSLLALDTPT